MDNKKRIKLACYTCNMTMSVVANISPILFLTFREFYGISFSLLGLLVLINFVTQLTVDLIFSFASKHFNIPLTVKLMPVIGISGLLVFALAPVIFPGLEYLGLCIGTVIFSVSNGLVEVLVSPLVAAVYPENSDREVSKLHSVYAWGVVGVVIIATAFLHFFGKGSWQILVFLFMLIPLVSTVLFSKCDIPSLQEEGASSSPLSNLKSSLLWLCFLSIFFGGSAECTMSQWCSGYLEGALGLNKVLGDVLGVALFGLFLGLGRTLFALRGKNALKVIFWGFIGASLCYLLAVFSPHPFIGLAACALTGFCASMLWPGNLIVSSDFFPKGGVFIFAMMAAGGDLGASVGPQLVGVVTDTVMNIPFLKELFSFLGEGEQLAMKLGMLSGALFPIMGIFISLALIKRKNKLK